MEAVNRITKGFLGGRKGETLPSRFVPEQLDDFAWENDRVAFRMYGSKMWMISKKRCGSGIDVWGKMVRYPSSTSGLPANIITKRQARARICIRTVERLGVAAWVIWWAANVFGQIAQIIRQAHKRIIGGRQLPNKGHL